MWKQSYTDKQLINAVKTSNSVWEVLDKINLKRGGGNYFNVSNRIKDLNIQPSWGWQTTPNKTFKYKYNEDALYKENATSYYLLGAYMTDGCVSITKKQKKIRLTSKDTDWLESIRDILCPKMPLIDRKGCHDLALPNTDIASWFISKGCGPAKSLTLKFPNVPEQYLPDFIRGCIDGDGSIGLYTYNRHTRGQCYLCSGSKEFVLEFQRIVDGLGFDPTFYIRKTGSQKLNKSGIIQKHDFYRININGKNIAPFLTWVYYPGHTLSMSRKRNIAEDIINFYKNKK